MNRSNTIIFFVMCVCLMSEIKTLKIPWCAASKDWCWRWCALQLFLFTPCFETEKKNEFVNMVCFCFGNPEDGGKIKRSGLKHIRILGNVYTMNILKIQKNSKQPLFSTEKFACISIQCTFLNSAYQRRWKAVLYHFKSMTEKYSYSCFTYKTRFHLVYKV